MTEEVKGKLEPIMLGRAPDGKYACQISRPEVVYVQGKANIVLRWIILEGEWKDEEIPDFYDLGKKAIWRLKRTLVNLGISEPGVKKTIDPEDLPDLVDGLVTDIEVQWDEDFERYKVTEVYAIGSEIES